MTFYICNLGCKVNAYETQVMNDLLINNGFKKGSIDDSDIYIINTCFVTNVAEHKSLQMIRKFKKKNPKLIIVCGCLSQMISEELKDIDIVIGNKDKTKIVDYINSHEKIVKIYDLTNTEFESMQLNNFDKTRAFVKIQDGCNNFCSYCIIPFTRGNIRCKKRATVLEEITNLVNQGHKEIVLTGIHTGSYNDEGNFSSLLSDIIKIDKLERLRISSIEITELDDDFLTLLNNPKIANHLHIPLQSGSDNILKLMNRKYDMTYFINKIKQIRAINPDINITTDLIVGFPGETELDFEETLNNIKKINFSKIHVFPYSLREKTVASTLPNQISEEIKKLRAHEVLKLSKQLELNYMNLFIDKEISFIPETYKDGYLIGHTSNYLLIKTLGCENLLHEIVKVKIDKINYPYCMSSLCK